MQGAFRVRVDLIHPDPTQPRKTFQEEKQKELAASIKENGLLQPIRIRPREDGHYTLTTGHRRLDAVKRLGHTEIDCLIRDTEDDKILAQQIVENWQRVDLEPLELSDSLAELRDRGHTQRQIADMLGKPESEISRLLSLQKVDPAIRRQVKTGEASTLTRRHLIAIASRPAAEQIPLARDVVEKNLTAEQTEEHVQSIRRKEPTRRKRGATYSKLRYTTSRATVSFVFRKQEVSKSDILAALDEVRQQVE